MFLGFIDQELGEVPDTASDPVGAWIAASGPVVAALRDPKLAAQEFDGFDGRSTFEAAADRFLCFDLTIHGWDLARATSQDEHIDPDDVERVRAHAESFGDAMRSPQAFGPALDAPAESGDQAKLLAFLGRQP